MSESPKASKRSQAELRILDYWKENQIYQKHKKQNENGPLFCFYEGPPTANGKPGIHHVLSRVYKDIYIRFRGLQGFHIPRKAGWDCHGLPVEREVEKQLGIQAKSEIETDVGLEKFNRLCRESVQQYVGAWNEFSERLGFWVDLDDPYYTMDNQYIEAVWGLFKKISDKGLVYSGYRVVPFDPVMGATMSDAEVALGYKTVEDPSFTVRFRILDDQFIQNNGEASFLVWTTTPWTLPSNVALALHSESEYVLFELDVPEDGLAPQPGSEGAGGDKKNKKSGKKGKDDVAGKSKDNAKSNAKAKTEVKGDATTDATEKSGKSNTVKEQFICAKELMAEVLRGAEKKARILKTFKGQQLVGLSYEPLFQFALKGVEQKSHYTVSADFVTMDTGTGIVHIAPAYGADDLVVGQTHDLPVVAAVGLDGKFADGPYKGKMFKEADKEIVKDLKKDRKVWRSEKYKHEYPFGWRTGAPLMYYAKDAWYIRTTDVRKQLIDNNQSIRWVPEHVREGRFGKWLENNRDWALSRERYWGTPIPIWTDGEGEIVVIGSVEELEKVSGKKLKKEDLHRPYIDEITWTDAKSGKEFRRVPEVMDCWFDSGAMPYAQWGYPVRGEEQFNKYFPADFITEAVDQTRGWFYTLLAISTMVSQQAPYKNVVCLGHVLDAKGEKMSKSKGNTVSPEEVFTIHSADAIRWYFLTGAPPGNSRRVGHPGTKEDTVGQVNGFFNMLENSLEFYRMYAKVDGIQPSLRKDGTVEVKGAPAFKDRPEIDRWILSSYQKLVQEVTHSLENYDCLKAGRAIEEFCDSLSNWYIRRNRRRFWKGELDADKFAAFETLLQCILGILQMLSAFVPFLSEELYLRVFSDAPGAPGSIHLLSWPKADLKEAYDESVLEEGNLVLQAASLGRSARQQSGLKVRQPLSKLMLHCPEKWKAPLKKNEDVLLEELNVKELEFLSDSAGILSYRVRPNLPVLGKKLGPDIKKLQSHLQNCDQESLARNLRKGSVTIDLGDRKEDFMEEEFLIESVSKEGTSGVEGDGMLVALDTNPGPELIREGWIRDLVRNVQELRKQSELELTDRISLHLQTEDEDLMRAIEEHSDYIQSEALATIVQKQPGKGKSLDLDLDGHGIKVTLETV
ncbi:MAG: isoleucine--tRNA ligase [Spirochaetaceae bacterium]|nr:isoleucine--tRNA ligase [Spirochaetaceae bacterium]|tara:strand:+ start:1864 stop:5259 length:3396 start_codon:yes stop_codon:yes gene_type:complete